MSPCASCGATLRPGARFCGKCGVSAAEAKPGVQSSTLYVTTDRDLSLENALIVDAKSALSAVQSALRTDVQRKIRAVCLVGDDHDLPFVRLEDPCGYDAAVLTDAPYGMRETPSAEERFAGDVLPDVPVTRIPTRDPETVRRSLEEAPLASAWETGLIVSCAVWDVPTRAVAAAIGARCALHLSPPHERPAIEDALGRKPTRLLFNVHGSDQEMTWYGQGDGHYPELLRSPGVRVADHGVVVSEACYGATLVERGACIAPTFLGRGSGAFFGSTIIAWGAGPGGDPILADELARRIFQAIDAGHSTAEALHRAKHDMIAQALSTDGGLSAPLHNTLLSFVAYGAPHRRSIRTSTAKPLPTLDDARASLQRRLTPGAWSILSSGRTTMAAIRAGLRSGDSVLKRAEQLLGRAPEDTRTIRYRAPGGERTSVLAHARSGAVVHRTVIDVASDGRILREAVSR